MDMLLKRYFWTVAVAFIAVASLLAMRTVNTYIGAAIEPAPVVKIDTAPRTLATAPSVPSVDSVRFGLLFGIEPPPEPVADESPAEQVASNVCWTCEPVKSNLRLQLLGTMVATPKHFSMALISDLDVQKTEHFTVGDEIKGAVIHDIQREPQRVVIVNHDTHRLEYIDGVPGSGAAVNTAGLGNLGQAPVPAPNAGGDGDDQPKVANYDGKIRAVGNGQYEVNRDVINETLGNLNNVATQARIVPSFKNGVANGFKLFSIRPGSLYSAIGIQNGDVITRINGYDMNSPEKALEVYTRLKDAANIEIEYERRGQPMKSSYRIQ